MENAFAMTYLSFGSWIDKRMVGDQTNNLFGGLKSLWDLLCGLSCITYGPVNTETKNESNNFYSAFLSMLFLEFIDRALSIPITESVGDTGDGIYIAK